MLQIPPRTAIALYQAHASNQHLKQPLLILVPISVFCYVSGDWPIRNLYFIYSYHTHSTNNQ